MTEAASAEVRKPRVQKHRQYLYAPRRTRGKHCWVNARSTRTGMVRVCPGGNNARSLRKG